MQTVQDQNSPTVKTNRGHRFYNAGDRLSEPLMYSLLGQGDVHAIAKHVVDAPEADYFWVPTELRLAIDGTRIQVDFPLTLARKFGERGVIMIDEEFEEDVNGQSEDLPFAATEADAKAKGDRLWGQYLDNLCRKHLDACNAARSAGGWPLEAQGFTKRALKLRGWNDPAVIMLAQLKTEQVTAARPSADVQALSAQVQALMGVNEDLRRDLAKIVAATREGAITRTENRLAARKQSRR